MPVCSNCGKENPDEARFCLACGTPIAEATPVEPAAPAEERKLITVVFTDLVGSTARSEGLDPEDVKAMVAPYHARVRAELERHGGTFEKFSGDAVMALFGAPVAHEDDCERAVRAAIAIRDAVAGLNEGDEWLDLHIRVGVNTGEALVTLDARPSEGEWMAAGDVMNTAARMQSAAPVDGIFVGQETYRQTRHVVEYRDAEAIEAKGKSERVPVWEAVALRDGADGRPTAEARLVGREAEREALMDWWRATVETRRPRIATVLGSPGIGKSRLLAELALRTGSEADVHWGRCLSYGEGITYWPVTEIVKDAAGIHHDDAAVTSEKLGALLESLECDDLDQLRTIAAAVSNIVGVATTPAGTYSAAEIGQAELHWGLRRLLELLAQKRPLVLVFEDLHWGEPTLLDLIQFVLESESEAPILLVVSARPEAKDARPVLYTPSEQRLVLELEALGESESAELLEELAAAQGLSGAALETVLRNAGGNPLFLEETVRMLAESGALAAADGEALPVPSSLQALIASRLDQLPGDEKRLAQHASVVGTVFWPGALASLNGVGDLDANLAALERRDIVRPRTGSAVTGEREYAFKHILIRDVAYNQLPKRRRAVLHKRFADWTEALPGEDEFVEIVAYHLEQACLIAREIARSPEPPPIREAAQALKRAGEKAESREGFREADRFYVRALELVGEEYRDLAAELHLRRGRMMAAQGELAVAAEGLAEVVEETAALDLQDLRCAALIALANAEWKQGHAVDSRAHLGEADEVAARLGDRRLEVRVAFEFAHLRWWIDGEHEAAIADLRRGLRIAEELEDRALRIEGHMRLGFLLFNLGDLGESETELLRCSALAGELGSHRDEARVTFQLALVKYYRGELDEAERLGAQAFDWFARTSDGYFQLQNRRALAIYALARSNLGAAEEFLRDALPAALDAGGFMVVEIYRYLIDVLTRQGRFDDARELLVFASRNVPEEDVYARAALLLAEATLATAGGEGNAATASFAEALRLLEDLQLVIDLAEARLAFGRALRSFGEETGARTELERARAMFARMDARFVLDEIDRELAELSPAA